MIQHFKSPFTAAMYPLLTEQSTEGVIITVVENLFTLFVMERFHI